MVMIGLLSVAAEGSSCRLPYFPAQAWLLVNQRPCSTLHILNHSILLSHSHCSSPWPVLIPLPLPWANKVYSPILPPTPYVPCHVIKCMCVYYFCHPIKSCSLKAIFNQIKESSMTFRFRERGRESVRLTLGRGVTLLRIIRTGGENVGRAQEQRP